MKKSNKFDKLVLSSTMCQLKGYLEKGGKKFSFEKIYNTVDDNTRKICDRFLELQDEMANTHFTEFTDNVLSKVDFSENNGFYGQITMLALITIVDMAYKEGGSHPDDCKHIKEIEASVEETEKMLQESILKSYKNYKTE